MKSLLCGSVAIDTIMEFDGQFSDVILPDQLHHLNAAFLVPSLRREFGGCAGNIAYNLKLLGGDPLIMATIGMDGNAYLDRLEAQKIRTECIRTIDDAYTAQAFITTDRSNHQLTAFHPGAMNYSHFNSVQQAGAVGLAMISPDGREGMLQHAKECNELNIPFIFDPGQGLPMFSGEELKELVRMAAYVTLNEYEAALLVKRTESQLEEIAAGLEALIVTHGAKGSQILVKNTVIDIPSAQPEKVVDPTGCGDAYRAGLIYGLDKGMDWEMTGRLASVMGAIKIECQGGQNHPVSKELVARRYQNAFGHPISLG